MMTAGQQYCQFQTLPPAPLLSAFRHGGGILRGDERVAFVTEPRALLGSGADFKQLGGVGYIDRSGKYVWGPHKRNDAATE
jgi:hypothetical protein